MLSSGLLPLPPVSRNDWKYCSSRHRCPSSCIPLVLPPVPAHTLSTELLPAPLQHPSVYSLVRAEWVSAVGEAAGRSEMHMFVRGGGVSCSGSWQPEEGIQKSRKIQSLWLSKGDHSALTAAQLFPSLLALPFLPIPLPVLINIYLIHLIPMEVWHQGIELKVYKINECEEKHEAIVQGRKCSQREWLAKRRKWEFLEEGSFPGGACEGRGQRSVSTVWWGIRAGAPRSVQEGPWKRRKRVSGSGSLARRSSCTGLRELVFRETKANGGPFRLLSPTPQSLVTRAEPRAPGKLLNGPSQCPPQPTKCFSETCSIPKTFSLEDQGLYAARGEQDSLSDTVAGGMGEEMTLAAVFGMHWRGEVEPEFIIDPNGTSVLRNSVAWRQSQLSVLCQRLIPGKGSIAVLLVV